MLGFILAECSVFARPSIDDPTVGLIEVRDKKDRLISNIPILHSRSCSEFPEDLAMALYFHSGNAELTLTSADRTLLRKRIEDAAKSYDVKQFCKGLRVCELNHPAGHRQTRRCVVDSGSLVGVSFTGQCNTAHYALTVSLQDGPVDYTEALLANRDYRCWLDEISRLR